MLSNLKWHLVVAQLVVLTCANAAHAERIADPTTDFAIDFDVPGADVCVIFPTERIDGGACGNLQAAQAAALFDKTAKKPLYGAIVKFSTWRFLITIVKEPSEDIGDLDAYTAGTSESIAARGFEIFQRPPAQRTLVNGIAVVELSAGTRPHDGGAEQWISTYSLCGSQANYSIYTASDTADHAQEVKSFIERALGTTKLAPVAAPAVMHAARTGEVIGYTLEGIAGAAALVVVIWLARRQLEKRRTRPARQPPPTAQPPREPRFKRRPTKKVVWDRDRDGP